MEQCLGRRIKDKEDARGRFQDGHRFFLEYRCSNERKKESDLCTVCQEWVERGLKLKDPYRNVHGLITESIPNWSHIYGGKWYTSKVGIYGNPSDEQMVKSKKAQDDARKDISVKPEPEPLAVAVEPVAVVAKSKRKPKSTTENPIEKPKVPSKRKPKAVAAVVAGETLTKAISAPPEKPKVQTKRKNKAVVAAPKDSQEPIVVKAVEALVPQTETLEIVSIRVKKVRLNEKSYFLDSKKQKVYSVGTDGLPHQYVGRWSSEDQKLDTSYPDSDLDL
jgi:hypothetical protein